MKNIFITISIFAFIISCNNSKNIRANTASQQSNPLQQNAEIKNLQQTGVDFFAEGNIPSKWTLRINYDDTVRFLADDGLALKFAYNQLQKDINDERKLFALKLNGSEISISIYEKICTLATSKEVFKKEVKFTFNKSVYEGCGKFLADATLNNKWLLEKIENTPIVVGEYNKIPEINFDLVNGTVKGNDGCNSFTGKIEVEGKRIQFSPMISTKKRCTKKNIEKTIKELISSNIVSYSFKEGKLYLYLLDDSLLIFKNVN